MSALAILAGAGFLGNQAFNTGKDIWQGNVQAGLQQQEIGVKRQMMQGQLASLETTNKANRDAASEYMAMFQSGKRDARKDKNFDRRMQLIMMMLQGQGSFDMAEASAQANRDIPAPPVGMMKTLGGR